MLTGYRFFSPFHTFHIKFKKQKKVKTFPLLKLPSIPLKYIINQLHFFTVIRLTMLSNSFKKSVSTAKLDIGQIRFHFAPNCNLIEIGCSSGRLEMEAYCGDMERSNWKLNGEVIPIHRTLLPRPNAGREYEFRLEVMAERPESKMEVMEKITQHLLSITSPKWFSVTLCSQDLDFKNLFLWKYKKRLENLKIFAPRPYAGYLGSQRPIIEGSWKNFDILPSDVTCRYLEFELDGVPYKEINKMVKDWIHGKYETLEELSFRFPWYFKRNDDPVFDGLNAQPTSFSKSALRKRKINTVYILKPIMDVKRIGDGRIGTLEMGKEVITLYVWHQKHLDECVGIDNKDS